MSSIPSISTRTLIEREINQIRKWNKQKKEKLKLLESANCIVTSDCIDVAVKYMNILDTTIKNYQAQDQRIAKQKKTMCK